MIMKKKSLVVIFISGLLVSLVLVLTLAGYAVYIQLKDEESRIIYSETLRKINARFYSKQIGVTNIGANIERKGPLEGKPVVQGNIRNSSGRSIKDMLLEINFLDKDDAVIYTVIFRPQEPPLGSGILSKVSIPYLNRPAGNVISPGANLPFKRILSGCPEEILTVLANNSKQDTTKSRWIGDFGYKILSLDFASTKEL